MCDTLDFDMNSLNKLLLISLAGTIFVLYTDIVCIPWILNYLEGCKRQEYVCLMAFRSGYFFALIYALLKMNLHKINYDCV